MKTKLEFKEGKHGIGYISSEFEHRTTSEFEKVAVLPRAIKLQRHMTDAEIESELKPGLCTLGDVLAVLESDNVEFKDGNWNLFYFEACVVSVRWDAGDREWGVSTWERGGSDWGAGRRVFSPATNTGVSALGASDALTLESLTARVQTLEEWRRAMRSL